VAGFDLTWLWLRALKFDHPLAQWIPTSRPGVSPWQSIAPRIYDVLDEAKGPAFRSPKRKRLSALARWMGIDVADYSGADVYGSWLAGDREAVREHCEEDVRVARQIALRLDGGAE
jgi:hypothetical protein